MVNLNEFTDFLVSQIGQPYVWGAQHLRLTPKNYIAEITKREKDTQHRADAIQFCENRFADWKTVLYAYDCSGLGMYYLQNETHTLPHDMTANGMMGQCEIASEAKCGYWVFRTDEKGHATHIGYMVSDTELIEAKGRKYGVVRTKYKASAWNKIGKPKCIEFDEPKPEPEPEPTAYEIKVHGRVKVREGNGKLTKKICTVGERGKDTYLPYIGQAKEKPYWYMTKADGQNGYISSDPKYTEIVEVTI